MSSPPAGAPDPEGAEVEGSTAPRLRRRDRGLSAWIAGKGGAAHDGSSFAGGFEPKRLKDGLACPPGGPALPARRVLPRSEECPAMPVQRASRISVDIVEAPFTNSADPVVRRHRSRCRYSRPAALRAAGDGTMRGSCRSLLREDSTPRVPRLCPIWHPRNRGPILYAYQLFLISLASGLHVERRRSSRSSGAGVPVTNGACQGVQEDPGARRAQVGGTDPAQAAHSGEARSPVRNTRSMIPR